MCEFEVLATSRITGFHMCTLGVPCILYVVCSLASIQQSLPRSVFGLSALFIAATLPVAFGSLSLHVMLAIAKFDRVTIGINGRHPRSLRRHLQDDRAAFRQRSS